MTRPAIVERPWFPAALVVVLAALVGVATMTPWMVGTYYDDGTYTVLAKSLATGQGYRYLNLPGAPVATHYPPGYPLFLAALWRIWPEFPANTALFKLGNVALFAVVALAMYAFCRRVARWNRWTSAAVAILGCITPAMLVLVSALMSEMLFLSLLIPALILAERLVREPGSWQRPAALGLLFGAALMVRTIGIPAVPAVALLLVLRGRWRDAILVSGVAALVVLPWTLWTRRYDAPLIAPLYSNYGSYGVWIGQAIQSKGPGFLIEVARKNLLGDAMYFGNRFMPIAGELPAKIALGVLLAVLATGMWRMRRLAPVTILYVLGYAALLLIWAFQPDRFFYSLEPLVAVFIAAAALQAWESLRAARGRLEPLPLLLAFGVALLLAGDARDAWAGISTRMWEGAQRERHETLAPLVAWVRSKTPPDAVIGVEADPLVYLYSGRRTHPLVVFRAAYHVEIPSPQSPEFSGDARSLLLTYQPDYTVARGPAKDLQVTMLRSLASSHVRFTPIARLKDGGFVLHLDWGHPRADSLRGALPPGSLASHGRMQ